MRVRQAAVEDLPAVEALRRADGDSLGFVPKAKYEHIVNRTSDRGRQRWRYEWLLVCEDNADVTGFCLASFGRSGSKIEQVCVREDARRLERALRLVDAVETEARRRGSLRLRCRVAHDIEANFFWQAAGYVPVAETVSTYLNLRPSSSGRRLIVYDKELDQQLLFAVTPLAL
jgi:ribosomal protein S18 acetylase RimI-like enzyme